MELDFKTDCKTCSDCCNANVHIGEKHFIHCKDGEAEAIAESTGMPISLVINKDSWLNVRENGDCIFRGKEGCDVHEVKPSVCVAFGQQYRCLFYPERSVSV